MSWFPTIILCYSNTALAGWLEIEALVLGASCSGCPARGRGSGWLAGIGVPAAWPGQAGLGGQARRSGWPAGERDSVWLAGVESLASWLAWNALASWLERAPLAGRQGLRGSVWLVGETGSGWLAGGKGLCLAIWVWEALAGWPRLGISGWLEKQAVAGRSGRAALEKQAVKGDLAGWLRSEALAGCGSGLGSGPWTPYKRPCDQTTRGSSPPTHTGTTDQRDSAGSMAVTVSWGSIPTAC